MTKPATAPIAAHAAVTKAHSWPCDLVVGNRVSAIKDHASAALPNKNPPNSIAVSSRHPPSFARDAIILSIAFLPLHPAILPRSQRPKVARLVSQQHSTDDA